MQSVDGFVFPHRASAGGGERGGVGGVGFGIDGHEDEAVAVTPVHPNFDCTGLALGPQNHRMPRLDLHIQYRFPGCRVDQMGSGDDPQILPDGGGELFKGFNMCHQGCRSRDDPRHDGWRHGMVLRGCNRPFRRAVPAIPQIIFKDCPMLAKGLPVALFMQCMTEG